MSALTFASVCSGIEAASVAWHPLGWCAAFVSEIEPFPCALLAHHYPDVPNHGDMTRYADWPDATPDVLVGGTPCQSFSVAGLRKGLADPRGNLMLTFGAIAQRYRPRWLVWENVPGVLSSWTDEADEAGNLTGWQRNDFDCFLAMLAELGYGFAYRILDAQYFGVPQRRRRVFVVGCLGDWRRAAAVLSECASMRGDSAPSREAGKRIANAITERPDRGGGNSEGQRLIAGCLNSVGGNAVPDNSVQDADQGYLQVVPAMTTRTGTGTGRDGMDDFVIAHSLRADGFDASEDGTGRGTPLVPVATAFDARQSDVIQYGDKTGPLDTDGHTMGIQGAVGVRRLTPRECERLQGFPDDYTLIPHRGKPAADGPRYKALGNSMAVPVMRWVGERITAVEAIS